MKKVTSITMHTTSEGQRLSYTYSVIDEQSGDIISSNNRGALVVLDIPSNKEVLEQMAGVQKFVEGKMEE